MKHLKNVAAVKGMVVHEGRALILRRACTTKYKPGIWEFAGGKLIPGEDPKEGLLREIQEETGMHASIERPLYATTFFTSEHRQVILVVYLCHAPSKEVTLSSEHQDYLWVDYPQLKEYLYKGIWDKLLQENVFDTVSLKGMPALPLPPK